MAEIVAAYGLPHTPFFPSKVEEEGPSSPTGIMFGKARDSLAAAKPDVIVIFDTDHYNTTLRGTAEGRAWLSRAVTDLGCRPYPSHTNFFLIN